MNTLTDSATGRAEVLDRIQRDEDRRLLIRGASIVSMDPEIGDLASGDLLIEGRRITAVGPDLGAAANDGQAIVVEAGGMIAIPGLQDTHRHSWQTQMRRLLCDATLFEYVDLLHARMGPAYRPHDIYVGTRLAAVTALHSGVTTVLDFSHNRRTSEHADAAVRAWDETGVRATIVPVRPLFAEWDGRWEEDLRRLRVTSFASGDGRLRLRVGAYARSVPQLVVDELDMSRDTARLADELGVGVTVDAVFGAGASEHLEQLAAEGVLSDSMTFIHCQGLSPAAWDALADAGCKVALAVTSDAQLGCEEAVSPIQQALDRGIVPGLSIDVECCLSSDIFTQMRVALNVQRMLAHQRRHEGDAHAPAPIPVREVLRYATIAGAEANGVADVAGSLTPGKEADVVLIRADDVDNLPLNNAVATVVMGTDAANVDTVLVAGCPKKWNRKLVGVDVAALRSEVQESRDRLLRAVGHEVDVTA
jgi:cytosine/adenosine deaminase-related metal-dependent hydrolase